MAIRFQWWIQDLPEGGAWRLASARSASLSLNGSLGGGADYYYYYLLAGSRGRAPVRIGGGAKSLKLKAFWLFSYKKWPEFKDLGIHENFPPCLRQTASRSHMINPKFWSMGGGGRPAARSAHSCIRHCSVSLLRGKQRGDRSVKRALFVWTRPVSHSRFSPTPADSMLSHRQPTQIG